MYAQRAITHTHTEAVGNKGPSALNRFNLKRIGETKLIARSLKRPLKGGNVVPIEGLIICIVSASNQYTVVPISAPPPGPTLLERINDIPGTFCTECLDRFDVYAKR